jgi:hypothetical protein
MKDMAILLKEADELGIDNIDVDGDQLSPEVIQIAINATKRLNSKLDKDSIIRKIQEAETVASTQQ